VLFEVSLSEMGCFLQIDAAPLKCVHWNMLCLGRGGRSQDTYPSRWFTRSESERLVDEIMLNDYELQNVHFCLTR
jgi:hypothetical protein